MALRKEPARRYQSVEQFSKDIRRHLEDVPVLAWRDTAWYRSSKFMIRHRVGVISSAVATVALLGGVAYDYMKVTLRGNKPRLPVFNVPAPKGVSDVRRLANSLMFEIHDSIKDLPGPPPPENFWSVGHSSISIACPRRRRAISHCNAS